MALKSGQPNRSPNAGALASRIPENSPGLVAGWDERSLGVIYGFQEISAASLCSPQPPSPKGTRRGREGNQGWWSWWSKVDAGGTRREKETLGRWEDALREPRPLPKSDVFSKGEG